MANLQEPQHVNGTLDLRKIDDIPEPYRSIFSDYPHFNVIQSAVFNDIFYSDEPIAVSAPTGSGKTTIFELAIVRLLLNWEAASGKDYKMVYISPTKALCEERLIDWHKKFSEVGVSCISVTGDNPNFDVSVLMHNKLIITTPEKWDSLTRRWRDDERIVRSIKLFMIDEIHLLNDESRGPTLEAIVTRMKTIRSSCQVGMQKSCSDNNIRLVGVSATISNITDIAEWFGSTGQPAKYFKFEDNMRPVKLQKIVQGYPYNPSTSSPFKFDIMLSYKLHNVLLQHSSGKPSLIFCSTRKSVEMTCKQLIQNLTIDLTQERKDILVRTANSLEDSKIKETLIHGVACHHAGMLSQDRRAIEALFREGNLPVLVTTSTLAMGVNLPAHLVVIKSTKYYANGEYKDYSASMLFQMIGRAGRPQFDTSAVAVIMTTASDKKKYENMVGGEQPVESYLHKMLAEHVNAEVVLRTITDLSIAMQWLSSTFFYIRARKNPKNYCLPVGLSQAQLDKKLLEMCQIEINKLAKVGMLHIDHNFSILPTRTGSLMAKYCAALQTMTLFTEITGAEILQQILGVISKSREFSDIRLRTNDKRPLNILNQNRNKKTIRFPLSGKIKTLDMKINCIIQAIFGCLEISESSLIVEAQRIMRIGERLSNCLSEYLENEENCYKALFSSITLAKCFHAKIWENSPYVSKQLEGIGSIFSNSLVAAGKCTFKDILNSNPRDLERILNKKPPFGNKIQDQVRMLPQYELKVKELTLENENVALDITITLENTTVFEKDITVNPNGIMSLLVGDSENNVLLHEKYTHMYMIENVQVIRNIQIENCIERDIYVNFISNDWVGIDVQQSIKLFATAANSSKKETTAQSRNIEDEQPLPDSTSHHPATKMKQVDKTRKSNMLQQCMDQYFKKVKPTKRENKVIQRNRSNGQIKRKTSVKNLEKKTTTTELAIDDSHNTSIEENNIIEVFDRNNNSLNDPAKTILNGENKLISDIVTSANDICKQRPFYKLNEHTSKQHSTDDLNDILPPTPICNKSRLQYNFLKNGQNQLQRKRARPREDIKTMDFETSIFEDSKFDFSQYVNEPKRKLNEQKPEEPKKICLKKNREDSNTVKNLTWSSPLVISPKCSESSSNTTNTLDNQQIEKNIAIDAPKKLPCLKNRVKVFSITDRECNTDSQNQNPKCVDLPSQRLFDYLGIKTASDNESGQDATSVDISGTTKDPPNTTKDDVDQTVPYLILDAMNTYKAPQTKIMKSSFQYSQMLQKRGEVQSKCASSQTLDEPLSITENTNDATSNLDIEIANKCCDRRTNKSHFQNQEEQNCDSSILSSNTWEDEFLTDDPCFDYIRNDQSSKENVNNIGDTNDTNLKIQSNNLCNQTNLLKQCEKLDKKNVAVIRKSSNTNFVTNIQTTGIQSDKYCSMQPPFDKTNYNHEHSHLLPHDTQDNSIEHNQTQEEDHWNWVHKNNSIENTNSQPHINEFDFHRPIRSTSDINRPSYEELHLNSQDARFRTQIFGNKYHWQPPNTSSSQRYYFCENLNNSQERNYLNRTRFNISPNDYSPGLPETLNRFGNNYMHQIHNVNFPYDISNCPSSSERIFASNKCLPYKNATFAKNTNFDDTNFMLPQFENNILRPATSSFYDSDQSLDFVTANMTQSVEVNSAPQKYANNFHHYDGTFQQPDHLRNIQRNNFAEIDESMYFKNNMKERSLASFMQQRASQNLTRQTRDFSNRNSKIRDCEVYTNRPHLRPNVFFGNNSYQNFQQPQYIANTNINLSNKNDFLLSRYFNQRLRQESPDVNRELLDLNHTVTSDYIQNYNYNF